MSRLKIPKICGIYTIEMKLNGKILVGSSKNVFHRFNQHKSGLRHNKQGNPYLQHYYNKYGMDALDFVFVEPAELQTRKQKEQEWINEVPKELRLNQTTAWKSGDKEQENEWQMETRIKLSKALGGQPIIGVNLRTGDIKEWPFLYATADDGFRPSSVSHVLSEIKKSHKEWFFYRKSDPKPIPNWRPKETAIVGVNLLTGIKQSFKSAQEASIKLNLKQSSIYGVVYGITNSCFDWFFYPEDKPRPIPEIWYSQPTKRVLATDLWTGEETIYESVSDAARALDLDPSHVSGVCRGVNHWADHYVFEHIGEGRAPAPLTQMRRMRAAQEEFSLT